MTDDHGWLEPPEDDAAETADLDDLSPFDDGFGAPDTGDAGLHVWDEAGFGAADDDLDDAEEPAFEPIGHVDDSAFATELAGPFLQPAASDLDPAGLDDASVPAGEGLGPADGFDTAVVGADPDLAVADWIDWVADAFPGPLDLTVDPVDGFPWIDADALGGPAPMADTGPAGGPEIADLYAYAAEDPPADGDAWTLLTTSQDPATSALARFWAEG